MSLAGVVKSQESEFVSFSFKLLGLRLLLVQLNLDGTVEVTHPDYSVSTHPLNRLTRLFDGIEQLEEDGWDEGSEHLSDFEFGEEEVWAMNENGGWQPAENGDEWVDDHGGMDDFGHDDERMDIDISPEDIAADMDIIAEPLEIVTDSPVTPELPSAENDLQTPLDSTTVVSSEVPQQDNVPDGDDDDDVWKRFEIQSSAPPDHAFFSTPHAQPSKSFLARLRREYRVLDSTLPGRFFSSRLTSVVLC